MQPGSASLALGPLPRSTLKLVARGRSLMARFLARHQLLLAKAVPTATGYAFGDCLTQQLGPLWPTTEWPSKHDLTKHDLNKTALMAGVGACVGAPLSLALYRWMDACWPGTGLLLAAGKFTLDQIIGCFVWQATYLSISEPYRHTLLEFVHGTHYGTHAPAAVPGAVAC